MSGPEGAEVSTALSLGIVAFTLDLHQDCYKKPFCCLCIPSSQVKHNACTKATEDGVLLLLLKELRIGF